MVMLASMVIALPNPWPTKSVDGLSLNHGVFDVTEISRCQYKFFLKNQILNEGSDESL